MKKCWGCKIVTLLAGIGALNWGLVGVFNVNLVSRLLGDMTGPARVVYTLVGIAGLLMLASLVKCCPCGKDPAQCAPKDAPPKSA